ncbi:MAG: hypothetical protein EOP10_02475 [Proteobacteria bacterium]|nr:MAG: hypothetical protein EOP10_02475 [Pseudomonadota bacterium]
MPLALLILFALLSYAEFSLISAVYRLIAARYDGASAILLILFSFLAAIFLGAKLIRHQGGSLLKNLRSGDGLGKDMSRKFLYFLAGILFIIPGYVSDVFALACLFPPTAWMVSFLVSRFARRLSKSPNFSFYSNLGGIHTQTTTQTARHDRAMDTTIIDVEVIDSPQKLL